MKKKRLSLGWILLKLMMCLIISAPSYPQKKVVVTETEVREWARTIQECKADQRAFKFAAVENMALSDSLTSLGFEYKIAIAELYSATKKNEKRFWIITALSFVIITLIYLLTRLRK